MKHTFSRLFVASILCFLPALAVANPLQLNLSPGTSTGHVTVELTNTGENVLSVLRWNTPFEAILSENVFQVTSSAKALPFVKASSYIGRHVKRGDPVQDNFLTLQPGESIETSVKLTDYYDIDQHDDYKVRFVGEIQHTPASPDQNQTRRSLALSANNTTSLSLISNEVSVVLAPQATARILNPTFNSCSANQQAYIQSATQSAELLTSNAVDDLLGLAASERATSPRYTTWFGAYTESRYNQVTTNMSAIKDALASEVIRYDCTCTDVGTYAYVYPIRPYDVFLCPEFHAADELGLNSRAGTIIHEISHFTIVAGTDDHAYQPLATQSLAINDPARAIDNADNYEYFAENTPALPIRGDASVETVRQFTPLSVNSTVTGNVATSSSDLYLISDAESVTLQSNSGDADLFIYADEQLTQLICGSENATQPDQCTVDNTGALYVSVFGYSASNYTLQVTGQTSEPQIEVDTSNTSLGTLIANQPISNAIEVQTFHTYLGNDINIFELTSLTGDADLLVYDGAAQEGGTLLCVSEAFSSNSAVDVCDISDNNSTSAEVLVYGYENSTYTLVGLAPENDDGSSFIPDTSPPTDVDFTSDEPTVIDTDITNPMLPEATPTSTIVSGSFEPYSAIAAFIMVMYRRRRKKPL